MRANFALSVAAFLGTPCRVFSFVTSPATSFTLRTPGACRPTAACRLKIALHSKNGIHGDREIAVSSGFPEDNTNSNDASELIPPLPTSTWRKNVRNARWIVKQAASKTWERMDTLRSAGFYNNESNDPDFHLPMQAGFKTNVGLLLAAVLWKWYRARFVTKIPIYERQPQWNMVVTSPEQEKELKAYECKKCGSTIFIARHREWFFKGGNTECTNCGAKGVENFRDIREDVIDNIDDDYFDYPNPLDFVSKAERRRLVKQAGGDEELAKQLAVEKAVNEDPNLVKAEGQGDEEIPPEKTDKKLPEKDIESNTKENETNSKKKSTQEDIDIFDELDMD